MENNTVAIIETVKVYGAADALAIIDRIIAGQSAESAVADFTPVGEVEITEFAQVA